MEGQLGRTKGGGGRTGGRGWGGHGRGQGQDEGEDGGAAGRCGGGGAGVRGAGHRGRGGQRSSGEDVGSGEGLGGDGCGEGQRGRGGGGGGDTGSGLGGAGPGAALTRCCSLRLLGFERAETHRLIQVKATRGGAHCKKFKNCLKYEKQSQQPDNPASVERVWEKGARSWALHPPSPCGPGTQQAAALPCGSVPLSQNKLHSDYVLFELNCHSRQ